MVLKKKEDKHNAELQRTDPGIKVMGEFSHLMLEIDIDYFHRFS